jgi:hypothetical protein
MKITTLKLMIFFIIGCSNGMKSTIEHPTEENLDLSDQKHSAILQINEEIPNENIDVEQYSHYLTLKEMTEVYMIGTLYGKEEEMFGRIEDVVIDSFNRVYILDVSRQQIRVFNENGDYISTIGGRGEGPGEFQFASSMAIYGDELLIVNNGYRLEVYDISSKKIEFVETVQLEKRIHSICISGDQLYLHSFEPLSPDDMLENENYIQTIHAYSIPSYEHRFSFGQSYIHDDFAVIGRLTAGSLGCNDSSSTVIFTFDRMPVIHGYSSVDGELLWKNRIDGLNFHRIIETRVGDGRSNLSYRIPETNIVDMLSPSITIIDEYEIFQVIRTNLPELGVDRTVEVFTFQMNSSNGQALYIGNAIPELVTFSNNFIVSRDLLDGYTSIKIYKSDIGVISE